MKFLFVVALLFMSACGVSYVAPNAELHVEFETRDDLDAALLEMQQALERLGFQVAPPNEGRTQSMLEAQPAHIASTRARQLAFWRYQTNRTKLQLSGTLTRYETQDDTYFGASTNALTPRFELRMSEWRPGGFSATGVSAFEDIANFLNAQGYQYTVVSPPPPDDRDEYARVMAINTVAAIVWWFVVWSITTATLGASVLAMLRRSRVPQRSRRIAFVLISVFLITPLPVPTMFMTPILPNALIPIFGVPFYAELWAYSPTAYFGFPASAALSAILAVAFIKDSAPRTYES